MIQMGSRLEVADNSGARKLQCIKVLKNAKCARLGDEIVVSIKDAIPRSKVKAGEVYRAVIVRTAKELKRKDGSMVQFYSNAAVLLDKQKKIIGTRIFGVIPRELKARGYGAITSLASEVL